MPELTNDVVNFINEAKSRSAERIRAANEIEFSDFLKKVTLKCKERELIPLEKGCAFPILLTKHGKLCVRLLYFSRQMGNPRTNPRKIYPVSHMVTVLWPSGRVIEYANLSLLTDTDYSQDVGIFPHREIADLPAKEYNEKRMRLMSGYQEFILGMINRRPFSAATRKDMGDILNEIMEPGLKAAYKEYGDNFFTHFCGKDWAGDTENQEGKE